MADPALTRRSPLGEPLDLRWRGARLVEHRNASLASIAARRGMSDELRRRLDALGLAMPDAPGRIEGDALDARVAIVWAGHEQWLASADGPGLAARLADALEDSASIVDQSGGWVELRLAGPRARAVLERLCAVDLDPAAFPDGAAARTAMEHLQVTVALVDAAAGGDGPEFTLLAPSSSARALRDALVHAATSACGESDPPRATG